MMELQNAALPIVVNSSSSTPAANMSLSVTVIGKLDSFSTTKLILSPASQGPGSTTNPVGASGCVEHCKTFSSPFDCHTTGTTALSFEAIVSTVALSTRGMILVVSNVLSLISRDVRPGRTRGRITVPLYLLTAGTCTCYGSSYKRC